MNFPNILTLSRIPFLFVIVGLMALPWPGAASLAFILFIVAGVTDWLDGYYARRYGMISNFGKLMDALTDKILTVGLFFSMVVLDGYLPAWFLVFVLLVMSREFFITGLRLVAAANGVVLAAEKAGKQKTVTQILALGFLLAAPMIENDLGALFARDFSNFGNIAYWTGAVLFIFATVLTVTSGLVYTIKYRRQLFPKGAGQA